MQGFQTYKEKKKDVTTAFEKVMTSDLINDMNYYIPMSSPKKSDYKDDKIRKSIVSIICKIS